MITHHATEPDRRRILAAVAAVGLAAVSPQAQAADRAASPWARGMYSRIRLASGGRATPDGPLVAAVEIALDRGFKTYWRTPGDSGIPPAFDFSGSENAADIKVHFPAPIRFDDGAGGYSIGYVAPLVELPVTFRPVDPSKPSKLRLKMDYAVCEKICVPASGQADLVFQPQKAASSGAARLLASLPSSRPIGATDPLAIRKLVKAGHADHFLVEAAVSGGTTELFVEADSPWLFDVKAASSTGPGVARFTVVAIDKDKSPDCKGVEVTFTLVSGDQAIETTTWLDVSLLSP
jgi:DsbC/DsbD-like thiol-disulfide interchange protein